MSEGDLRNLQWMASRYASKRSSYAVSEINEITARLIDSGINLYADAVKNEENPTVWACDGDFGWPHLLIDKYGWDGKKQQKEDK